MKKQLLICSALALAGCSSAPGTGDIENFLKPKFASCQNIEIVDIKKTNGYEEDGYYRVEYTFGVELKNTDGLKALLEQWTQEKSLELQYAQESKQFHAEEEALNHEIRALKQEFAINTPPIDSRNYFKPESATQEQSDAYMQAANARLEQEQAFLRPKLDELNALQKEWKERRAVTRASTLLRNERNAALAFYYKGCPRDASKMSLPMFDQVGRTISQTNDPSDWFKEFDAPLQGSVTMRKTENGWRALSAG